MNEQIFKRKSGFIALFFLIWSLLLSFKLIQISILKRNEYIEEGKRLAWRKGIIPASRGSIYDKNKVLLAWTERYFDLVIERSELTRKNKIKSDQAIFLCNELSENFKVSDNNKYIRIWTVKPEILEQKKDIIMKLGIVKIKPRLERKTVSYSAVKLLLGEVKKNDGSLSGITGIEKEFDEKLKGINGEYAVMLDRCGKIIPGTIKELVPIKNGKDIFLDKSLHEIMGRNEDEK